MKWLWILLAVSASAQDVRLEKLHVFLSGRPAEKYCEYFLYTADQNKLDWRLLPALSVVESSGGKHARGNNWFGWNSGRDRFETPEEGIDTVAFALTFGVRYQSKDFWQQMKTYNPHPGYGDRVYRTMSQIEPLSKPRYIVRTGQVIKHKKHYRKKKR